MIYCATRLAPSDKFIYNHFFDYYKNELGIQKFLINFNYRIGSEEEFELFVDKVLKDYKDDIIYNIGPNDIESAESSNINQIKKLTENYVSDKDFILTADSDEFHFIPIDLQDTDSFDFDYMYSSTIERFSPDFSANHSLSKIKNYKELFKTFNFDLARFCMPKISLSRKNLFIDGIGVGHHAISEELREKSKAFSMPARVNHFKWHKEGVGRMQFWNELWSHEEYHGWKGCTDKQINAASDIFDTGGDVFIINEVDANLENEFHFEFDYSLTQNPSVKYKDINIHIVNECDVHSMNNKLYRQFQNIDSYDPFQIFCYKSRSGITFVNKIDLFFFNGFYGECDEK